MEISSSPKSTTSIPNDVIVEVLSWAPANSLWRFKWASKYWFDLLRDPKFIKLHLLRHSTTSVDDTSTHEDHSQIINNMFFLMPTRSQIVYSMRCMDVLNQSTSPKTVKMDYYSLHPLMSYSRIELEILGSCNGLIYFYRYSSRIHWNFLWNPSTSEFKELPLPSNLCVELDPDTILHGFGYDHIMNDYKVVRVTYLLPAYHQLEYGDGGFNEMRFSTSKVTDVYTLGSNSWSTIKSYEYCTPKILDKSGVYLNGILHWMKISLGVLDYRITITSFNIAKEEHQEIRLPEAVVSQYLCFFNQNWQKYLSVMHKNFHRLLYLSVSDESLCIFHMNDYDKGLVDVWMMKVYGIKESWIKLFSIDMKPLRENFVQLPLFYLNPLMYRRKDGEILMVFGGKQIIVYDPKKKIARYDHNIEDCHYKGGCVVGSYIGSLVSLNSGKYFTPAGSITVQTQEVKREAGEEKERIDEEADTKMKKQKIMFTYT